MTPLERELVRRLVYAPEAMSRNRNFHAFTDAMAWRARRTAAHLRSIRRALLRADVDTAIQRSGERWEITVVDPANSLRRVARIGDDELAILREDPAVAAMLDR